MRQWIVRLTYANVISTVCLFLLLGGGTAVALNGANTVQSDDLGPGAQVKAPRRGRQRRQQCRRHERVADRPGRQESERGRHLHPRHRPLRRALRPGRQPAPRLLCGRRSLRGPRTPAAVARRSPVAGEESRPSECRREWSLWTKFDRTARTSSLTVTDGNRSPVFLFDRRGDRLRDYADQLREKQEPPGLRE